MYLIAVALIATVASAARLENNYLPPTGAQGSGGNGNFLAAPFGRQGPSAPASSYGAPAQQSSGSYSPPAAILRYNNDNNGEGAYRYDFETENRISQQETGELRNAGTDNEGVAVQGSYSYAGPDGATYTVNYIADENGFRADGAHLPTPPPVPAEILRALEQNSADEAAGRFDDGQYREEAGQQGGAAASRQYLAPNRPSFNAQTGYNY